MNDTFKPNSEIFSAYSADDYPLGEYKRDQLPELAEQQGLRDEDLDIAHPENYDFDERMPRLVRDQDYYSPWDYFWDVTSDPTDIIFFKVRY